MCDRSSPDALTIRHVVLEDFATTARHGDRRGRIEFTGFDSSCRSLWRRSSTGWFGTYISEYGFTTHRLDESFRWGSDRQEWLTRQLRRWMPVTLPAGSAHDADVVLAHRWKTLWDSHPHVLPLAIKPRVGQVQEAICTLLLNEITQNALGLEKEELLTTLRPCLQTAISRLKDGNPPSLVWQSSTYSLADRIPAVTAQQHARKPLSALARLQLRLEDDQLVPGPTCHQSKGREWNTVAIKLSGADSSALALGLDPSQADHRALYVALTRARLDTLALA